MNVNVQKVVTFCHSTNNELESIHAIIKGKKWDKIKQKLKMESENRWLAKMNDCIRILWRNQVAVTLVTQVRGKGKVEGESGMRE